MLALKKKLFFSNSYRDTLIIMYVLDEGEDDEEILKEITGN